MNGLKRSAEAGRLSGTASSSSSSSHEAGHQNGEHQQPVFINPSPPVAVPLPPGAKPGGSAHKVQKYFPNGGKKSALPDGRAGASSTLSSSNLIGSTTGHVDYSSPLTGKKSSQNYIPVQPNNLQRSLHIENLQREGFSVGDSSNSVYLKRHMVKSIPVMSVGLLGGREFFSA